MLNVTWNIVDGHNQIFFFGEHSLHVIQGQCRAVTYRFRQSPNQKEHKSTLYIWRNRVVFIIQPRTLNRLPVFAIFSFIYQGTGKLKSQYLRAVRSRQLHRRYVELWHYHKKLVKTKMFVECLASDRYSLLLWPQFRQFLLELEHVEWRYDWQVVSEWLQPGPKDR
jgi:hypothetical protein